MKHRSKRSRRSTGAAWQRAVRVLGMLAAAGWVCSLNTPVRGDLVLETETAQLGKKGTLGTSTGVQLERGKDGSTTAFTLNQFEYAVSDRIEILVEPFFYQKSKPKDAPSYSGVGDIEITPSWMIVEEAARVPAVVLSFKVKVPTATNRDIGTGEFDYQPFVILGKTSGPWTFNANLGVDFVTSPSDEPLKNQFIYDLSVERAITPKWSVFGEIFGNSSPADGEKSTFAGAIATEYKLSEKSNVFVSFGYDTDRVANVRFGINIEF